MGEKFVNASFELDYDGSMDGHDFAILEFLEDMVGAVDSAKAEKWKQDILADVDFLEKLEDLRERIKKADGPGYQVDLLDSIIGKLKG